MKAIGLLVIVAAAASAQQFELSLWFVRGDRVDLVAGPPLPAPIVVGGPYSADQLEDDVPPDGSSAPTSRVVGHFARDTQGRTREEQTYKPAPFWLTHIFDPIAGVAYLLDDHKHIAYRMALPPAPADAARAPADSPASVEALGTQPMQGVLADGTRKTYPPLTIDTWESPELKITLLEKSSNGYSTRLINLNRAEPDSRLFEPPPDYAIVDQRNLFPLTIPIPAR